MDSLRRRSVSSSRGLPLKEPPSLASRERRYPASHRITGQPANCNFSTRSRTKSRAARMDPNFQSILRRPRRSIDVESPRFPAR
jgi:hypothetical protein